MARLYWTDRARDRADSLPERAQQELRRLTSLVSRWPEMYQEVQDPPHWRGHRKFVVLGTWAVFYRFRPGRAPAEDQVYVRDIVPARGDY